MLDLFDCAHLPETHTRAKHHITTASTQLNSHKLTTNVIMGSVVAGPMERAQDKMFERQTAAQKRMMERQIEMQKVGQQTMLLLVQTNTSMTRQPTCHTNANAMFVADHDGSTNGHEYGTVKGHVSLLLCVLCHCCRRTAGWVSSMHHDRKAALPGSLTA